MAMYSRQISSPVVVIPARPLYQTQLSAGTFGRHYSSGMHFNATPASCPQIQATSRGRKRSRDEASTNLEPDSRRPHVDSWQNNGTGGNGAYVEESTDQGRRLFQEKNASQMESRSRKAQRLDHSPDQAPLQASLHGTCYDGASKDSQGNLVSTACGNSLVIDAFTILLGIGWRQLGTDEHVQAAARGWARFIEKHFKLSNVGIRLESRGLQSYLVEAAEGYFLFAENLRRGRLVSRTPDKALHNLQLSPPVFEGPELDLTLAENQQFEPFTESAMAIDE
ncbi:uncharacterized protein UV8b_00462 [Ustilaginoidea virens]|uniref:Uncharacterized protein n=1 Tax=Ustilaginoidea virens TaxID=1159556 RepID=A0A8E5MED0_USTVR|nr:uncharacterized protein UV8b_00462 [Ustilaginoidea virens]QUC16221.1 hypothetical protein UV8b_00462 [Ustilaginoidea virens]